MVNRSIEAKRIKYLKQKRARPRALRMNKGYQKVGSSVDKSKVPEKYQELFNYRSRGNTSGEIDGFLERIFPSAGQISKERAEAIQSSWNHTIKPAEYMYTELVGGKKYNVKLFHNSELTVFFIVEEQARIDLIRWSVTYNNRDRIVEAFASGTIQWLPA